MDTKKLNGFSSKHSMLNAVLWNMHKHHLYSNNYKELLSELETSDQINSLDTVAWAYKDNDNKDKAVKLYQNKIMPFVEKNMSQEEIEKFKGYFEEIKK